MGQFSFLHWAIVLLALFVHFIPTVVAFQRTHPKRIVIVLINLLLGWTAIAWVGALIWALTGPSDRIEQPAS
jgi:ABC-type transport system involved in cytochrome c biogenesis permease component